jgi:hypothetical protein
MSHDTTKSNFASAPSRRGVGQSSMAGASLNQEKKKRPKVFTLPKSALHVIASRNLFYSTSEMKSMKPIKLEPMRFVREPEFKDEDPRRSSEVTMLTRGLLGMDKTYRFRIGTALNMSSSVAGVINSSISAATVATTGDFASLASIFEEFFVESFHVSWRPVGQYVTGPLGTTISSPTTNVSSLPIGVANLHHGAPAYTTLVAMVNNGSYDYHQTDTPFDHTWKNVEVPSSEVVVNPTGSAVACQGWCLTTSTPASAYTGFLQILSQPALGNPVLPVSAVLGTFTCQYNVLFRCRS